MAEALLDTCTKTHKSSVGGRSKRCDAPVCRDEIARITSTFLDEYTLTPREREIAFLICLGEKNICIARKLGVSDAAIGLHITNIHRKLGTGSKVEIVLKIFQWWLDARA